MVKIRFYASIAKSVVPVLIVVPKRITNLQNLVPKRVPDSQHAAQIELTALVRVQFDFT